MAKQSNKKDKEKQRLEKIRSEVARELNIDIEKTPEQNQTAKLVRDLLGDITAKAKDNGDDG